MDDTTTIADLKNMVQSFCEQRDWDQYHTPKELGIGMITEASELLEQFRFLDLDQQHELLNNPETRSKIEDELADITFFILRFAQRFDIDLHDALTRKNETNKQRYPVDKARGQNLKYTEL